MTDERPDHGNARAIGWLALGYVALGALARLLAAPPAYASPVFPAAGLALAGVLRLGRGALAGVWAGSFALGLVHAAVTGGPTPRTALLAAALAFGAMAQAAAGRWLVLRWSSPSWRTMEREQDALRFLLLGGVLASVISASISVTSLWLAGFVERGQFPYTWWNWYVGDVLGVLVFAPLTFCFVGAKDDLWRKRRRSIVVPLLAALGLVALVFYGIASWERQREKSALDAEGRAISHLLRDRLVAHHDVLASLRNFIEVTPDFTFRQFEQFTRLALAVNRDISALEFLHVLPGSARASFEARMTEQSPVSTFQVRERDAKGALVPAAPRSRHVVVSFVVPLAGNEPALGYDLYSEPARAAAIDAATASGKLAVTAPIRLVQEREDHPGMLEILPISVAPPPGDAGGDHVIGFTAAVVRLDEMIDLATAGHVPTHILFEVADPDAPAAREPIYRSRMEGGFGKEPTGGPEWSTRFAVGQRQWLLTARFTEVYRHAYRHWLAWTVGVAGLLFTTLVQVLLLGVTGRAAETERRNERVRESEERLREAQGLAHMGNWELDLGANRLIWSDEIFRIFEIDPRRFGASYEAFLGAIHPEDREAVNAAYTRSLESRTPYEITHRLLMADGRVKFVRENGESFYDAEGRPLRSVGTVQDITSLKQAEADIHRAKKAADVAVRHLEATLGAIPDLLFEVDRESTFLAIRAPRASLLAAAADHAVGKKVADLLPPDVAAVAQAAIQAAEVSGADYGRTYKLSVPEGERWFELSVACKAGDGSDAPSFVVLSRDITERKRAEEALAGARRTLLMVTRCNEAILRATGEKELFRDLCRVIVEVGGYRLAWVGVAENDERKTIRPLAHAGHDEGYLGAIDVVWADVPEGHGPTGTAVRENRIVVGGDFAKEARLGPWKDEALRRGYASVTALPVSFEGRKYGVLSMYSSGSTVFTEEELGLLRTMAEDVGYGVHALRERAARVRADASREAALIALSTEQDRFRSLIEGSSDLTIVIDRQGIIGFASPASQAVMGRPPSELVGSLVLDHIHPDDRAMARAAMSRVLSAPGDSAQVELRIRRIDETWALVESGLRNLLEVSSVRGIVVNNRDITERSRLREQVQQSQKLESIGRLAGGVAHDFNNLLTVILACAEDLREQSAEGKPLDPEYLRDIVDAGRRAGDLTKQLLAFARKQVSQPVTLDLNVAIRDSEKLLRRVIGEDIRIEQRLEPAPWMVRCDPGLVTQVLMNLALNARDAMPKGGKLVLATGNVAVAPHAPVPEPGMPPGAYVRLVVEDSGVGIPDEVMPHIFEPFFTTKGVGKGTGLGLATVYGIVKQSGAYIGVKTSVGAGTSFEIFFPRDETQVSGPAVASTSRRGGTETILLVEDEPQVREVTARMLRSAGYRVLTAEGGEQAAEIAKGEPDPIHLLVTDMVMPGEGGREVARRISGLKPGVRILYISGYTEDAIARRGALETGLALVAKPFSAEVLLGRVREILDA